MKTENCSSALDAVELFGKTVLLCNSRISLVEADNLRSKYQLYFYCLRGSDYDPGMPIAVERAVLVNFAGTVISAVPLLSESEKYRSICEYDINYLSEHLSIEDYVQQQKEGG